VDELGLRPRARIVDTVVVGSEPVIMLTGPIPATEKILRRTGMTIHDIDLVEINEAFAPVPMITMQEVGIPHEKVNVNGGAIALGHPLAGRYRPTPASMLLYWKRGEMASKGRLHVRWAAGPGPGRGWSRGDLPSRTGAPAVVAARHPGESVSRGTTPARGEQSSA